MCRDGPPVQRPVHVAEIEVVPPQVDSLAHALESVWDVIEPEVDEVMEGLFLARSERRVVVAAGDQVGVEALEVWERGLGVVIGDRRVTLELGVPEGQQPEGGYSQRGYMAGAISFWYRGGRVGEGQVELCRLEEGGQSAIATVARVRGTWPRQRKGAREEGGIQVQVDGQEQAQDQRHGEDESQAIAKEGQMEGG